MPKSKRASQTNAWDVFIKFLEIVYDLCKTGNLYGVVLFSIICYFFLVTLRLPAEDLSKMVLNLASFISAEKYYLVPLTIALTVSLWGNLYQRNKYQGEIKRLTEIRKRLMHGLEKKELKEIKEHKTSNFTFKKD